MRKSRALQPVVVSECAYKVFSAYFGIGCGETPHNVNEQLCALGGRIAKDGIKVMFALPLLAISGGGAHVVIGGGTWFYAMQVFAQMQVSLVGSVHTHPCKLPVFMSGPDRETHRRMFPDGASLICNPQRNEMQAFRKDGKRLPLILPD
ncbi:MAG: hypothetical protein LBT74_05855 [Acidobacteriota bacterium]|jgi:hypothetical protein|nr:hypothetical protein [Acidobacteriota bacterium]